MKPPGCALEALRIRETSRRREWRPLPSGESPPSQARQPQRRAQTAERAVLEPQRAAVDRRQIDDDREAEARAGAGFVEPPAALERGVARPRIESGTVVVDMRDEERPAGGIGLRIALGADLDASARPFARIVEQVADEVREILRLAAKAKAVRSGNRKIETAVAIDLLERPDQFVDDRANLGGRAR